MRLHYKKYNQKFKHFGITKNNKTLTKITDISALLFKSHSPSNFTN